MKATYPSVGALRERLLARELAEARAFSAKANLRGLITEAERSVAEAEAARFRFESFASEIESPGASRCSAFEKYLTETVRDPKRLAGDLRSLRRGEEGFDVAALADRVALESNACEYRAEAFLAVARSIARNLPPELVESLLGLARKPGRWSRRTEALAWFRKLRPGSLPDDERDSARAALTALVEWREHRWVQPAALSALAAIDEALAHDVARERLGRDYGADDFIVRARIIGLVGQSRRTRWLDILPLAHADDSELVRMSAVAVEPQFAELERIARADRSHRVRVSALIRLARRHRARASSSLADALCSDAHPFVVQTAAEELLAVRRKEPNLPEAGGIHALEVASRRADVPESVRLICSRTLFELGIVGAERLAMADLAAAIRATPVGGSSKLRSPAVDALAPWQLARVAALVADKDFGIGLDPSSSGLILHRGDRERFSAWRFWFELSNPRVGKRQGVAHTTARTLAGALRAPPAHLAEVTPTRVPGERVLVPSGGWGREVPRVDDLLSTGVLRPRSIRVAGIAGVSTVTPAPSLLQRLRGAWALTGNYAKFAALRQRTLSSGDAAGQGAFARDVLRSTGIVIETAGHELSSLGSAALLSQSTIGLNELRSGFDDFANRYFQSGGIHLSHLAGYGVALLGTLVARQVMARHRIEAARSSIPLVIGGWGTRGKSGTERLKAALLHGLGYECLVKTTGCEAMFIHAVPGVPAREIFVYRPYDKATVWEQETVLELAARLGVRAFLWECMALQPELVNLLQSQWMHDDVTTITNAYPDHEDVQGPTGFDVATTIAEFVPHEGVLLTTEVEMLPVLRERAAFRGTRMLPVAPREVELVPSELLARFSHAEHPANVALVSSLARHFGISSVVAITEMADNVVPDLGALKTYPAVKWRGRTLSFTNGMGANDRAGTLENWRRTGFADHDPATRLDEWIVTVVNNRADRPARTEVFAEILVGELAAHRHVLIGSNIGGLVRALGEALERRLLDIDPTRDLAGDAAERRRVAVGRMDRAFAHLMLVRKDPAALLREAKTLDLGLSTGLDIPWLIEPHAGETCEEVRRVIEAALAGRCAPEYLPFAASLLAGQRVLRGLCDLADTHLEREPRRVAAAFSSAFRSYFFESLVILTNPDLSGDGVIDAVALATPPGARVNMMGIQNIKGTALDFVYRWVSIEQVHRAVAWLDSGEPADRERGLMALLAHEDFGLVDATYVRDAVEAACIHQELPEALLDAVRCKMTHLITEYDLGSSNAAPALLRRARKLGAEMLDVVNSVRRRRQASGVLKALVAGRISHASAARQMRRIVHAGKL